MHKKHILYCDLKSTNIMVRTNGTCCLIDFGTSCRFDEQEKFEAIGSPLWMAPEVYLKEKYTTQADIFSFGIVLCELITGMDPYHEQEEEDWEELMKLIIGKHVRPEIPVWLTANAQSSDLIMLIHSCLDSNPSKRPRDMTLVLQQLEKCFESAEKFPARTLEARFDTFSLEYQETPEEQDLVARILPTKQVVWKNTTKVKASKNTETIGRILRICSKYDKQLDQWGYDPEFFVNKSEFLKQTCENEIQYLLHDEKQKQIMKDLWFTALVYQTLKALVKHLLELVETDTVCSFS